MISLPPALSLQAPSPRLQVENLTIRKQNIIDDPWAFIHVLGLLLLLIIEYFSLP